MVHPVPGAGVGFRAMAVCAATSSEGSGFLHPFVLVPVICQ